MGTRSLSLVDLDPIAAFQLLVYGQRPRPLVPFIRGRPATFFLWEGVLAPIVELKNWGYFTSLKLLSEVSLNLHFGRPQSLVGPELLSVPHPSDSLWVAESEVLIRSK